MEEEIDVERTAIRKELSSMSFEDILKLKERLGSKVYDEAMFGTTRKKPKKTESFKRVNKNRPREMSSKIPVPVFQSVVPCKKAPMNRDPRFDSLCGSFNEKVFKKAYKFVETIKSKEKDQLKEELKVETDPERKEKMKYLVQRLENQERESLKRQEKAEAEREERMQRIELLKKGEKPRYLKKSEKQTRELVQKFEELKKSGKLQKHIQKHRKKATHKDRKRLQVLD